MGYLLRGDIYCVLSLMILGKGKGFTMACTAQSRFFKQTLGLRIFGGIGLDVSIPDVSFQNAPA